VQNGSVALNAGGSNSGATTLASGTSLILGGTHNVNAGASFTGAGTLTVSSGTVNINAPTTVASRYSQSGGIV